jgi:hypothetical protein
MLPMVKDLDEYLEHLLSPLPQGIEDTTPTPPHLSTWGDRHMGDSTLNIAGQSHQESSSHKFPSGVFEH